METLLAWTRAVVLIGSVAFAFAMIAAGFYFVQREYRLIKTWKQLSEFIKETAAAGVSADAVKGTVALTRARPGLIMMGIGAVILCFSIMRTFSYERTDGGGQNASAAQRTSTPRRAKGTSARRTRASSPAGTSAQAPPKRTDVTADDLQRILGDIVAQWLPHADELRGKDLAGQAEVLQRVTGAGSVKFDYFNSLSGDTPAVIANDIYGDRKYAPLVLAANPEVKSADESYPDYTLINVFKPQVDLPSPRVTTTKLKIAGKGREELYDVLLEGTEKILADPSFAKDPAGWFKARGLGDAPPIETFARQMQARTSRQWGTRPYIVEEGETPATIAKAKYGDSKYLPILQFTNYDRPDVLAALGKPHQPMKPGTELRVLNIISP